MKDRLRFSASGWVSTIESTLRESSIVMNYNKLSDAEFRQLVHILEKSKYFKSYVGQRKKRK